MGDPVQQDMNHEDSLQFIGEGIMESDEMNVNSLDDNDNVNHNDNYNDLGSPLSIDDDMNNINNGNDINDINIINGINDVNDSIDIIDIAETQNVESDNDPL